VKGSYVLLIRLPEAQIISPGSLPEINFRCGYYAYVGSALGGLESRLNRHLHQNKKRHWHIDYLLPKASITEVVIGETENRVECAVARALSSQFGAIPDFGSSDCHCPSHLFFAPNHKQLKSAVLSALEYLAIPPKLMALAIY